MKHTPIESEMNSNWTKAFLLADLMTGTAFHIGSHGIVDALLDNFNAYIYSSDVIASRTSAQSNGIPPINVALVDACLIGQTAAFFQAILHPWSDGMIDRAALGYTISVQAQFSPETGEAFWNSINSKQTVGQARLAVIFAYNKAALADESQDWQLLNENNTLLFGDPKTRLKGVYTGTQQLPSTDWYREAN